mgnify:CR=1 FL=1
MMKLTKEGRKPTSDTSRQSQSGKSSINWNIRLYRPSLRQGATSIGLQGSGNNKELQKAKTSSGGHGY